MREFEELYQRFRTRMYAMAYALTSNRDRAEEIVQETFARAWRSFSTLRDPASVSVWLRAILINVFRDSLKERRNRRSRSSSQARPDPEDPVEIAARAEDVRLMRALIFSMNERDRVLLDLSHLQGHSNEEISKILGIEADHVRVLLHRARKRLAELFRRYL